MIITTSSPEFKAAKEIATGISENAVKELAAADKARAEAEKAPKTAKADK